VSRSALLIVDMINAFDLKGAAALMNQARHIGPHIVRLKMRTRSARAPGIYCNDNFGVGVPRSNRLAGCDDVTVSHA
jgi:nicotinamidase-related amidase